MLVLTRKKSEEIRINNDIVVKIIHIGKNKIKVGIEAPMDIRIVRGELPIDQETVASTQEDSQNLGIAENNGHTEDDSEVEISELDWYLSAYAS